MLQFQMIISCFSRKSRKLMEVLLGFRSFQIVVHREFEDARAASEDQIYKCCFWIQIKSDYSIIKNLLEKKKISFQLKYF